MLSVRVLTGAIHHVSDVAAGRSEPRPFFTRDGRCIDTIADEDENVFVKINANDVYPDQVDIT